MLGRPARFQLRASSRVLVLFSPLNRAPALQLAFGGACPRRCLSLPPLSGAPPPPPRCPACTGALAAPSPGAPLACAACAATAVAASGKKPGVFARLRALGPTAIKLYAVLFAVPWLGVFAAVYTGAVPASDPLLMVDTYLPAAMSGGIRSGLGTGLGWVGVTLPAPGEPMPPLVNSVIWAYVVADIVEIPRIGATLWLTPKLVAWLAARKAAKAAGA
jgi:hypothetical protein